MQLFLVEINLLIYQKKFTKTIAINYYILDSLFLVLIIITF